MNTTSFRSENAAPQQRFAVPASHSAPSAATIGRATLASFWHQRVARLVPYRPSVMTAPAPRQIFIRGVTRDGKPFRPSDWAERLAGAMSSFRPNGARGGIGAFIGYSPYCEPRFVDGVKSVLVSDALRALEPMAWDFVMNFARDNDLQVLDADGQPAPGAASS